MEKKKVIKELARTITALKLEAEFKNNANVIAEYLFKQLESLNRK